jgi:hypothetical protein
MERLRQGGATWQAKQEYQVTVLNFVDAADLKLLHQDCFLLGALGHVCFHGLSCASKE